MSDLENGFFFEELGDGMSKTVYNFSYSAPFFVPKGEKRINRKKSLTKRGEIWYNGGAVEETEAQQGSGERLRKRF